MRKLFSALKDKSTRDAAIALFPIVAAIAAGCWAVVTYFVPRPVAEPARVAATAAPPPPAAMKSPVAAAASTSAPASAAPTSQPPSVSASEGGIAIGGSVGNSTISISGDPREP